MGSVNGTDLVNAVVSSAAVSYRHYKIVIIIMIIIIGSCSGFILTCSVGRIISQKRFVKVVSVASSLYQV